MSDRQTFNITTIRPGADMFVGKVTITEHYQFDAETAFEALKIFMMVHTREYNQHRACLLGIKIELATAALNEAAPLEIKS